MQLTERDKILSLIIPAALVIAVYGFWFNSSKQGELSRLRKAVADAKRAAPPEEDLLRQRARLGKTKYLLDSREQELAKKKQYWDEAAGCFDPATRTRRLERLNRVLVRHGLHLVKDSPVGGGQNLPEGRISPALQAFAKELAKPDGKRTPSLWWIRLEGRYPDVLAALKHLAEGEPLAVPIGLSMKANGIGAPVQEWMLLVWM